MAEVIEVPAFGLARFLIEKEPVLIEKWNYFCICLGLNDDAISEMKNIQDKKLLFVDTIKRWVSGNECATVLKLILVLTDGEFINAAERLRLRFGYQFNGAAYFTNLKITQSNSPLIDDYRVIMEQVWEGFPLNELIQSRMYRPDWIYEITDLVDSLREFNNNKKNQIKSKVLVTGTGQFGKSELARNFAFDLYSCKDSYDCIWISGNEKLKGFNDFLINFCGIRETDWRLKILALSEKFAGRKWLLIFDQIDQDSISCLHNLVLEFKALPPKFDLPIIIVTSTLDNPQIIYPSKHIQFLDLGQWKDNGWISASVQQ